MGKQKYYAVALGRKPGVYLSWPECQGQTKGFSGAKFKSFGTRDAAEQYLREHHVAVSTSSNLASTKIKQERGTDTAPDNVPVAKRHRSGAQSCFSDFTHTRNIKITVHFDGGSRGNPSRVAGSGAEVVFLIQPDMPTQKSIVKDIFNSGEGGGGGVDVPTKLTVHIRKFISKYEHAATNTNNVAEYEGLIVALSEIATRLPKYLKVVQTDDPVQDTDGGSDSIEKKSAPSNPAPDKVVRNPYYKEGNKGEETSKVGPASVLVSSSLGEQENNALNKSPKPEKSRKRNVLIRLDIQIIGDSQLIIRQMKGEYKCNSANIRPQYEKAKRLEKQLSSLDASNINASTMQESSQEKGNFGSGDVKCRLGFEHAYRRFNTVADALANEAMDERKSWTSCEAVQDWNFQK